MKQYQREFYIIYEPYLDKVYENPENFNPSYGVDFYFRYLDLIDIKKCSFASEKRAKRKLEKLRKFYLEEKKIKQGYRKSLRVGDSDETLHVPSQEEFEEEILKIFDRHYVIRKLTTQVTIGD